MAFGVGVQPQVEVAADAVAGEPDGEAQVPIAGRVYLMSCHSCWHQRQVQFLSPLSVANCLLKKILSVPDEAWLVPSGYRQVPVCLLRSELTCVPARRIRKHGIHNDVGLTKKVKMLRCH